MKKVTKLAMFLLAGTLATGFTSCSSNDDEGINTTILTPERQAELNKAASESSANANKTEMGKVVANYLEAVVKPTYLDLAQKSDALYNACQNLYKKRKAGKLTQSDIDAACEAFKGARKDWEQSEAFLYGAASDNEIDPHIDSWPLDHDQLTKALNNADVIAGINGENPTKYVYDNNGKFDSVLGFHGLEFVLFRNGKNRTVADFNAEKETEQGLTSVSTVNEAAFAAAVAGDLRNMTYLLEYSWLGTSIPTSHLNQLANAMWVVNGTRHQGLSPKLIPYRDYSNFATTDKGYFTTWHETLNNIFIGGCVNICEEVASQKLGQAYRKATGTGTADDAANYIESPYSKRSFQDYQDNIYSIKNTLYGVRGTETISTPAQNSIMNFLKNNNYPKYNDLNNALNEAISALETAKKSGIAFIDNPGHAQVKNCIDKVDALNQALNEAGTWINQQTDK